MPKVTTPFGTTDLPGAASDNMPSSDWYNQAFVNWASILGLPQNAFSGWTDRLGWQNPNAGQNLGQFQQFINTLPYGTGAGIQGAAGEGLIDIPAGSGDQYRQMLQSWASGLPGYSPYASATGPPVDVPPPPAQEQGAGAGSGVSQPGYTPPPGQQTGGVPTGVQPYEGMPIDEFLAWVQAQEAGGAPPGQQTGVTPTGDSGQYGGQGVNPPQPYEGMSMDEFLAWVQSQEAGAGVDDVGVGDVGVGDVGVGDVGVGDVGVDPDYQALLDEISTLTEQMQGLQNAPAEDTGGIDPGIMAFLDYLQQNYMPEASPLSDWQTPGTEGYLEQILQQMLGGGEAVNYGPQALRVQQDREQQRLQYASQLELSGFGINSGPGQQAMERFDAETQRMLAEVSQSEQTQNYGALSNLANTFVSRELGRGELGNEYLLGRGQLGLGIGELGLGKEALGLQGELGRGSLAMQMRELELRQWGMEADDTFSYAQLEQQGILGQRELDIREMAEQAKATGLSEELAYRYSALSIERELGLAKGAIENRALDLHADGMALDDAYRRAELDMRERVATQEIVSRESIATGEINLSRYIADEANKLSNLDITLEEAYRRAALDVERDLGLQRGDIETRALDLQDKNMDLEDAYRYAALEAQKEVAEADRASTETMFFAEQSLRNDLEGRALDLRSDEIANEQAYRMAALDLEEQFGWANIDIDREAQRLVAEGMSSDDAYRYAALAAEQEIVTQQLQNAKDIATAGMDAEQAMQLEMLKFSREELESGDGYRLAALALEEKLGLADQEIQVEAQRLLNIGMSQDNSYRYAALTHQANMLAQELGVESAKNGRDYIIAQRTLDIQADALKQTGTQMEKEFAFRQAENEFEQKMIEKNYTLDVNTALWQRNQEDEALRREFMIRDRQLDLEETGMEKEFAFRQAENEFDQGMQIAQYEMDIDYARWTRNHEDQALLYDFQVRQRALDLEEEGMDREFAFRQAENDIAKEQWEKLYTAQVNDAKRSRKDAKSKSKWDTIGKVAGAAGEFISDRGKKKMTDEVADEVAGEGGIVETLKNLPIPGPENAPQWLKAGAYIAAIYGAYRTTKGFIGGVNSLFGGSSATAKPGVRIELQGGNGGAFTQPSLVKIKGGNLVRYDVSGGTRATVPLTDLNETELQSYASIIIESLETPEREAWYRAIWEE